MTKGSDGGGWLSHREERVVVIVRLRRGEKIVPKPKDWAATTVRDYRRDQARENQKAAVDYRLQGSLRRRRRQILVRVHRSVVARLGKDRDQRVIPNRLIPTYTQPAGLDSENSNRLVRVYRVYRVDSRVDPSPGVQGHPCCCLQSTFSCSTLIILSCILNGAFAFSIECFSKKVY